MLDSAVTISGLGIISMGFDTNPRKNEKGKSKEEQRTEIRIEGRKIGEKLALVRVSLYGHTDGVFPTSLLLQLVGVLLFFAARMVRIRGMRIILNSLKLTVHLKPKEVKYI